MWVAAGNVERLGELGTMRRTGNQTRTLLFIGFGGLLLLLAFLGVNALSIVTTVQDRNNAIRSDYVNRDRILEQLRSDIYLSGTYVRDLLLEPDPSRADVHRKELEVAQERINATISEYEKILRPEERAPFHRFTQQLNAYFDSLQPVVRWTAEQRRALGYTFMQNSLLPRRLTIVRLADQIGEVNQRQLQIASRQVADLFSRFHRLLMVLLLSTLIGGVLLAAGSFYRILRLEQETAGRFNDVVQARSALRDLSTRLLEVQETERRALSRELHDEVGQSLSALLIGIANLSATISPKGNAEISAQIQEIRRLAERTVAVVRDMSLLLRPSMLDDLGLIPAVQWQAREVSRTHNIKVQVYADSVSEDLSDECKTCIYRVVQEALRNVVRHANANHVQIRLSQSQDTLLLTIQDDGQGFEPEREKGVGLLGMEERVFHLHGTFQLESRPGQGTLIRVELPYAETYSQVAV
jgi:signal transduction histidine kinase